MRQLRRPGPKLADALALAALLAALALVLFAALTAPMKDDVAWLLYVAGQWLRGGRLYQDLVEVNPPLIIWIYALPVLAARGLGVAAELVVEPLFAAFVLGCAAWSAALLHGRAPLFGRWLPGFAAIAVVLLLLPAVEFGQREHLLIAAGLPYFVLWARGVAKEREPPVAALAAGALAGLFCALKPPYLAAYAVLELAGLWGGARLFSRRSLAFLAAFGLYGLAVLVCCPAYVQSAVPLALALYGGTDTPWGLLLAESAGLFGGVGAVALLALLSWRRPAWMHPFVRILLAGLAIFAAVATLTYLLEGKNWFYHRLPADTAVLLALLLWLAAAGLAHPRLSPRLAVAGLVALAAFADIAATDARRLQHWTDAALDPGLTAEMRLERLVRREHAKSYIAFTEWIGLGFPVVNNTKVVWASRFDSMWALQGELWRIRHDGGAPRQWPIRHWIARDFLAACPDLAVVDTRGRINYVAVVGAADAAFARAWAHYHQIAAFDGLRVLKRDRFYRCAPLPAPRLLLAGSTPAEGVTAAEHKSWAPPRR